ncbi:DUF2892 domain-containing protein [Chlorobium phaeovibrioides]|uniref:DUF2892 domain-containing protein n=2 Tax=Chlorobium phaeovibrioides TaxID=1094 RepID=A0A432AY90_CHLPH|nr:DUF2892 domain-containing protein [Chlorobium phaeovibrioides]MWV54064.1 DUF2892 domain-containing protein [Chlorobium phaeovibrioides]RTY35066.1 DUF2892 domain-containing protein [Chlorobium phaeovibrioides]RTY40072.1 DUF2892 domain-containing protein [Chlorobium phaeovibrioides]HCD35563.1 DUF2892 domain-containing protein [Chlorobium sp.]
MNIDKLVLAIAGLLILLSVALALTVSNGWLWLTGVVGFMMLQSAFTGFCPMALILKSLGVEPGNAFK